MINTSNSHLALVASIVTVTFAFALLLSGTLPGGNTPAQNDLFSLFSPVGIASSTPFPLKIDTHVEPKTHGGDAALGKDFLRIEPHWMDNFGERHCEECTMIEYTPGPNGFAEIAYELDSSLDLSGAKRVKFFAMGEEGGEKLVFKAAGSVTEDGKDPKAKPEKKGQSSPKFKAKTSELTLANDWKRYEIPLGHLQDNDPAGLENISHPFGFEVKNGNGVDKVRIYIHGIVIDSDDPQFPERMETLQ